MHIWALLLSAGALSACAPTAIAPPKCPDPPAQPQISVATPAISATESVVTAGDFKVTVRATPFGNLAYQLDCLAGAIGRCTVDAIRPFWTPTWTKDDDAALAAWKEVRTKYRVSAELAGDEAPSSLVVLPYRAFETDKQLRIASLLAATPDEYRANLRVLVTPQDAEALVATARRFRPRFDAWWSASGAAMADRFRIGLAAQFEKPELAAIVTRAAAFYATPLAKGTPIDFDLVLLPAKAESTHGEQLVAHGVMEIPGGAAPEERMDLLCHEVFHFFYNARSPAQQAALAARFTSSSDPLGAIAYFLVDESVATALGNGVVNHAANPSDYARRRKLEGGFYSDHAIDAMSKGLLARTNEDPTLGPRLDSPETVRTLIAATRDAVGEDPRPIEYLHSFTVESESERGDWREVMRLTENAANANSEYRYVLGAAEGIAMVTKHPALSVIFVVARGRSGALEAYGDAVPKEARSAIAREEKRAKGAFAFVLKRSAQARAFVIVAEDAAGAKGVADALFKQEKAVLGVFRVGA